MEQKIKFSLRMSEEMMAKVQHLANFNNRSINGEIQFSINRAIRDFERLNGEIPTHSRERDSQSK